MGAFAGGTVRRAQRVMCIGLYVKGNAYTYRIGDNLVERLEQHAAIPSLGIGIWQAPGGVLAPAAKLRSLPWRLVLHGFPSCGCAGLVVGC